MTTTTNLQWAFVTLDDGIVIKAQVRERRAARGSRPATFSVLGPPGFHRAVHVTPKAEPTPHELASRALFAGLTGASPERWHIIETLPPGIGVDFADATDGVPRHDSYGQAWRNADGKWGQAPHTKTAVLLRWAGPSR
jgi:hypothetical protein